MGVVGAFSTLEQARRAVDEVIAAGIDPGAVTARTQEGALADLTKTRGERLGDVVIAAAIGALLGSALAWMLGTSPFVGMLLGGLAGALARLGFFRRRVGGSIAERTQAGQYLVAVDTDDPAEATRAQMALMNAGAEDVHTTDRFVAHESPSEGRDRRQSSPGSR